MSPPILHLFLASFRLCSTHVLMQYASSTVLLKNRESERSSSRQSTNCDQMNGFFAPNRPLSPLAGSVFESGHLASLAADGTRVSCVIVVFCCLGTVRGCGCYGEFSLSLSPFLQSVPHHWLDARIHGMH